MDRDNLGAVYIAVKIAIATKITLQYLRETIQSQCVIYWVKKQLSFLRKQRQLCYLLWVFALFHLGKQQGTTKLVEALLVDLQQPLGSYSLSRSSARWMCLFLSLMQGIRVCDPSAPHASPYDCIDWRQRKTMRKWKASMHQKKNWSTATPGETHPSIPLWPIKSFKQNKKKQPTKLYTHSDLFFKY